MSLKLPKEQSQKGRKYENSIISSFYGSPDAFIGMVKDIRVQEELELKDTLNKINSRIVSAYER
jgi:hypothetical protein